VERVQFADEARVSMGRQVARREQTHHSSLSSMLTRENIALSVRVRNWQQAVRKAGRLLVGSAGAEPRYVDAMIEMVKEIGPYIVIAPGVALPHARPEDGVLQPCMSLVTLKPPVNFGNENNDPVSLIVAFGATESDGHLEALRDLARLLENEERLARLKCATTVDDVLEVINGTGR